MAIAEARYHRALHKVDTHDREPNSAQQVANKLHADVRFVLDGLPERVADGPADPFDLEYAQFGLRQVEKLLVEVGRERRLYRRYLGEARASSVPALPRRGAGAAQKSLMGVVHLQPRRKPKNPETNSIYHL